MRDYVILIDTTCDLSPELREEAGIAGYVPCRLTINGEDMKTTLDWSVISREEYYKLLGNKTTKATTAPPSPFEYAEAIEEYVKQGKDVLFITVSSGISGAYNFLKAGAEEVQAKYPEAKIYPFDSFRLAAGAGYLAFYAGKLKQEGKSLDEVIEWLEANKKKTHQMGPVDDLVFLARRGRISMGKAVMGTIIGIKPMGDCNEIGFTTIIAKEKGLNKAIDFTAAYCAEMARNIQDQYILVAHSDRETHALRLKEKIEALGPKKVYITDTYSTSATGVGPGMVAVYFLGEEISEGLAKEKAAVSKITGK